MTLDDFKDYDDPDRLLAMAGELYGLFSHQLDACCLDNESERGLVAVSAIQHLLMCGYLNMLDRPPA